MNFDVRKWLPTRRNRLALEALLELAYARVLRATHRFYKLAKLFGEPELESAATLEADEQLLAKEIGNAICRAVRYAPFKCNCLTQAICGLRMLNRRRISSTLYLGVDRSDGALEHAHAWLRCGNAVILGDSQLHRYRAIFKFART